MPVTREQLNAAGVGEASIVLFEREQRTGEWREAATPRDVAAAAGVLHALVFQLDGRVASAKNHTRPTVRDGKVIGVRKSKVAEAWAKAAVPQLEAQRPRHHVALEAPVCVALVLRGPIHHPHSVDGDNALSGILDALVTAKVLGDDRPRIVRKSSVEWRPAAGWSAVITITPYEGPAA